MLSIVVTKQDLQTKTLLYQCSTRKFCTGAEAFATTLRTRLQACYREFSKEGTPTHEFKSAPQGKFEPTKKASQLSLQIWSQFFCSKLLRPSLATSGWVSSSSSGSSSSKSNKGHHYSKSNINSKRRSSMHSEGWLGTLGKSCGSG